MPTTIRDVAAAAGVSPATVSRVLNGKRDVGADLRRRVLGVVSELGYRRNGPARSLRTRAAMVLGLIISDITNPFFTAVVRGAGAPAPPYRRREVPAASRGTPGGAH